MNTEQIYQILCSDQLTKSRLGRVCALDQLPDNLEKLPCIFVCNTDPSNLPGQHWIALYFDEQGHGEYFDSLGPYSVNREIVSYMDMHTLSWHKNENQIQSLYSNVCGQYCIYFLMKRCRNISINTVVNHFTSDFIKNDIFISDFIKKYYPWASFININGAQGSKTFVNK